jgi:DNA-binding NarL/FixJ family response regulator
MQGRIRILMADDHVFVREGTRELLEREEDMEVIAEAGDGEAAVQLAIEKKPDLVLMDIAMPKLGGVEATRQIKAECPGTAILVLTAYDDDQYVFALLEAGAAGYLLKNVRAGELINAIRSVHAGESILHPTIARKVIDRLSRGAKKAEEDGVLSELTDRELDVLKLAARGLSNRDIAVQLSVSNRTVQAHLSTIFNKMQVGSRTEAVVLALRRGWIDLEDTV